MKLAATVLYEDSYAISSARFGLHAAIVRLVADELPSVQVYQVEKALNAQPMNGVGRVLDALWKEPARHAPNGRMLVGCVDDDQLERALHERNLADAAALKAASPLTMKVDLFALGRNTEALIGSAASIIACDESLLRAALRKDRLSRDRIFQKLASHQRRGEFRARNPGVDAVVKHLTPYVAAFLSAGANKP